METVLEFWAAMPGEMRTFLAVIIGASFHFARNRQLPIAQGLLGFFFAVVGGVLFCYAFNIFLDWDLKQAWVFGAGVAFMTNYLIGGMETTGKQIEQSGVKWLIDTAIDTYVSAKEKIFGTKK